MLPSVVSEAALSALIVDNNQHDCCQPRSLLNSSCTSIIFPFFTPVCAVQLHSFHLSRVF